MAALLEHGQRGGVHKLILQRDDIHQRREFEQRLWFVPIADERASGEAAGGKLVLPFQDHDLATKLRCGLRRHLGKLAAADDAERECRPRFGRRTWGRHALECGRCQTWRWLD